MAKSGEDMFSIIKKIDNQLSRVESKFFFVQDLLKNKSGPFSHEDKKLICLKIKGPFDYLKCDKPWEFGIYRHFL